MKIKTKRRGGVKKQTEFPFVKVMKVSAMVIVSMTVFYVSGSILQANLLNEPRIALTSPSQNEVLTNPAVTVRGDFLNIPSTTSFILYKVCEQGRPQSCKNDRLDYQTEGNSFVVTIDVQPLADKRLSPFQENRTITVEATVSYRTTNGNEPDTEVIELNTSGSLQLAAVEVSGKVQVQDNYEISGPLNEMALDACQNNLSGIQTDGGGYYHFYLPYGTNYCVHLIDQEVLQPLFIFSLPRSAQESPDTAKVRFDWQLAGINCAEENCNPQQERSDMPSDDGLHFNLTPKISTISGRVITQGKRRETTPPNRGLEGQTVQWDASHSTVTDDNGRYQLQIPVGTSYSISVTSPSPAGYERLLHVSDSSWKAFVGAEDYHQTTPPVEMYQGQIAGIHCATLPENLRRIFNNCTPEKKVSDRATDTELLFQYAPKSAPITFQCAYSKSGDTCRGRFKVAFITCPNGIICPQEVVVGPQEDIRIDALTAGQTYEVQAITYYPSTNIEFAPQTASIFISPNDPLVHKFTFQSGDASIGCSYGSAETVVAGCGPEVSLRVRAEGKIPISTSLVEQDQPLILTDMPPGEFHVGLKEVLHPYGDHLKYTSPGSALTVTANTNSSTQLRVIAGKLSIGCTPATAQHCFSSETTLALNTVVIHPLQETGSGTFLHTIAPFPIVIDEASPGDYPYTAAMQRNNFVTSSKTFLDDRHPNASTVPLTFDLEPVDLQFEASVEKGLLNSNTNGIPQATIYQNGGVLRLSAMITNQLSAEETAHLTKLQIYKKGDTLAQDQLLSESSAGSTTLTHDSIYSGNGSEEFYAKMDDSSADIRSASIQVDWLPDPSVHLFLNGTEQDLVYYLGVEQGDVTLSAEAENVDETGMEKSFNLFSDSISDVLPVPESNILTGSYLSSLLPDGLNEADLHITYSWPHIGAHETTTEVSRIIHLKRPSLEFAVSPANYTCGEDTGGVTITEQHGQIPPDVLWHKNILWNGTPVLDESWSSETSTTPLTHADLCPFAYAGPTSLSLQLSFSTPQGVSFPANPLQHSLAIQTAFPALTLQPAAIYKVGRDENITIVEPDLSPYPEMDWERSITLGTDPGTAVLTGVWTDSNTIITPENIAGLVSSLPQTDHLELLFALRGTFQGQPVANLSSTTLVTLQYATLQGSYLNRPAGTSLLIDGITVSPAMEPNCALAESTCFQVYLPYGEHEFTFSGLDSDHTLYYAIHQESWQPYETRINVTLSELETTDIVWHFLGTGSNDDRCVPSWAGAVPNEENLLNLQVSCPKKEQTSYNITLPGYFFGLTDLVLPLPCPVDEETCSTTFAVSVEEGEPQTFLMDLSVLNPAGISGELTHRYAICIGTQDDPETCTPGE